MKPNSCKFNRLSCLYIAWIILNSTLTGKSQTCTSFKNVFVQFKAENGGFFNQTINGCIERIRFDDGITVVEALIRKQNDIIRLGQDSIRNMIRLSKISFVGCSSLEIIESACFRNVPNLRKVQITFCKLRHIPKDVFNSIPQLEILRLNNNLLETIDDQALANLSSLQRVYLNNNKLDMWNKDWFSVPNIIKIIDFKFNKLNILPHKAFSTLKHLKEINLGYNELESINLDAFANLSSLEFVGLSHNKIKVIYGDILSDQLKFNKIELNGNLLNFLAEDIKKSIIVKSIKIHYNPWNCKCLENIYSWIRMTNGTIEKDSDCYDVNIPECAVSKVYPQQCIESTEDELTNRYLDTLKSLSSTMSNKCQGLGIVDIDE